MAERQLTEVELYTLEPSYDNLVEVVKLYLNRNDAATVNTIPFFINAAEKTILRLLRMPSMEKTVQFTLGEYSGEEGWIRMPHDYLEMRYVWTNDGTMQRVPFDQIFGWEGSEPTDSEYNPIKLPWTSPEGVWAINGDRMYINGVNEDVEVFMTYYQDIEEISAVTQGNILLTLVPDAFVFLSVAEGWNFLQEHEKASVWQGQATDRINAVMQQVEQAEFSGSPLTIRPHSY